MSPNLAPAYVPSRLGHLGAFVPDLRECAGWFTTPTNPRVVREPELKVRAFILPERLGDLHPVGTLRTRFH
jgi:hypothetical protein